MRNLHRACLALAVLALAAWPAISHAQERVARQGNAEVRVWDTPCVSAETIARIPEKQREGWNKVQGRFGGQTHFGCWRPYGDSVYILWDDGDQGLVPLTDLKPVTSI